VTVETILQEAQRITDGDRAKAYGKALPDAERWATIFGALTGFDVRPEHFPLALLATKLSRLSQAPQCYHRDSVVDIAGYARVIEKIWDDKCERDDVKDAAKRVREAA
jgi:hypothetical protein